MIERLKCRLGFHDYQLEYAKDREENTCYRAYLTDAGEWVEELKDGCTLVDVCQHCGVEDEMKAPASIADRRELWRD